MRIDHRIRNTKFIRQFVNPGANIVCAVINPAAHSARLAELGFSMPLEFGESLVPAGEFGISCDINANGWVEVHKDQPMETAHRQKLWRWRMKRGYGYEEDQRIVDVPYKRYPRTEHPPVGLEIRITPKVDGTTLLTLPRLIVGDEQEKSIVTAVNLLVEIFGECHVLTENLDALVQAEIKRLNWRVLPPGQRTWDEVQESIKQILETQAEGRKEVIEDRLQHINAHKPTFMAIGNHGFSGYLVMGFPAKGLYLLESIYFGNATYVLDDMMWPEKSGHGVLSKGETNREKKKL